MGQPRQRTALVTGGTAGIGLGIAQRLVDDGLRVVVTGRSEASIRDAADRLGPAASVVPSDAADVDAVKALAEHVSDTVGELDLLVLNAGYGEPTSFADVTEADFDRVFGLNAKGPFFAAQALGLLVRDGGAIILTTSIGASMARPPMALYDASKAALRAFTRSLAAEFLPRGVRVNAIAPGGIDSTIMDRAGLPDEVVAQLRTSITEAAPMKRFGRPEEVAAAVVWLAFEATFPTGAEIPLDGGWSQLSH